MNGLLWIIGGVLPYAAMFALIAGIAGRAIRWKLMPKSVHWTFFPPPQTLMAQARFMAAEIFTFHAVWKRNKVLWIGAWTFHVSMAILVVWLLLMLCGVSLAWLCWLGAALMGFTSAYLIVYRFVKPEARALSTPVEFFNLGFFFLIVLVSGAMVLFQQPPIEEIRRYLLDILAFRSPAPPQAPLFYAVLFLVEMLMIYFPFSRMIHMVSKYFAFHTIDWGHA